MALATLTARGPVTQATACPAAPHLSDQDGYPADPAAADCATDAREFFAQLVAEGVGAAPTADRVATVVHEITATGSYRQTTEELAWGTKVAWRNTPRCLGKFYWKALAVRDMRHLTTADEVFAALVEHLRTAYNNGRVKLLLTVFAPRRPDADGIRIWNKQLVRHAGYRQTTGASSVTPTMPTSPTPCAGWAGRAGPAAGSTRSRW